MALIRVIFVIAIWLVILVSCSNVPKDLILVDVNGAKHFHTLQRVTSNGNSIRFCQLHDTWEYVKKK